MIYLQAALSATIGGIVGLTAWLGTTRRGPR
jgi:hypothetical protein